MKELVNLSEQDAMDAGFISKKEMEDFIQHAYEEAMAEYDAVLEQCPQIDYNELPF